MSREHKIMKTGVVQTIENFIAVMRITIQLLTESEGEFSVFGSDGPRIKGRTWLKNGALEQIWDEKVC